MALEELTRNMREMARRASDFRPASDEVHAELLAWQRNTSVDEESGTLDASLQQARHPDHIWEVEPERFVFGTRVPYSIYHVQHRLETGRRSHMDLPQTVLGRIATKLGRYITQGTTL